MSYKSVSRRRALRRKQEEPRSWLRILLVVLLCASVLFAVGVLLGNFLKNMAELVPPRTDENEDTLVGYFNASQVPVILAEYSENSAAAGGTVGSDALLNDKSPIRYNAVSLVLRTETETSSSAQAVSSDGFRRTGMQLHYTSAFSSQEPFDDIGTVELSALLGNARKKHGYVSGVFAIGFFREPALTKSLVREYEISLLTELSANGLDDAVLSGVPESALPEVIKFIREVSERTGGKLKLGIAMDFAFFDAGDIKQKINLLHYDCGFFAIDLRGEAVPTLMTPQNFVYDRIGRIASTVSLYSVRVMVGIGPAEGYLSEAESAFKAGSLNIMTVPKDAASLGGSQR